MEPVFKLCGESVLLAIVGVSKIKILSLNLTRSFCTIRNMLLYQNVTTYIIIITIHIFSVDFNMYFIHTEIKNMYSFINNCIEKY